MARYKLQGRARDTWGNAIASLDIYIYKSGTGRTQDAIIYTSRTSTTAISAAPQIASDQYGSFKFWVDDTDYGASTTKFDIYADGLEYTYVDVFNIKNHSILSGLPRNDHPQYPALSAAELVTGDWTSDGTFSFTVPPCGVTPSAAKHLVTKDYVDTNFPSASIPSAGGPIIVTNNWYFTVPASGVSPSADAHFAIKQYVDAQILSVSAGGGLIEPIPNTFAVNPDNSTIQIVSDEVAVIQTGLDHTNLQNRGTNTHAQIDSLLSSIETSAADINTTLNDHIASASVHVSQTYIDNADASTLSSANSYTDAASANLQSYADAGDVSTLSSANSYSDMTSANALTQANNYTDVQVLSVSASVASDYLRQDGTTPLEGNWDAGPYDIKVGGDVHISGSLFTSGASIYTSAIHPLTTSADAITITDGGDVELYHNGSKAFETTGTGVDILHPTTGNNIHIGFSASLAIIRNDSGEGIELKDNGNDTVASFSRGSRAHRFYSNDGYVGFELDFGGANIDLKNDIESSTLSLVGVSAGVGPSNLAVFDPDGAAELYYAGVKSLETYTSGTDEGFKLTHSGDGAGTSGDITFTQSSFGHLTIYNPTYQGRFIATGTDTGPTTNIMIQAYPHSGVELYHSGDKVFETDAGGIEIWSAAFSTRLSHNSSNFVIRNQELGGQIYLESYDDSGVVRRMFDADPDGSTSLYTSGAKILETTEFGVEIGDGTNLASLIYSAGAFVILNHNHGGNIDLRGENLSGSQRILFRGDPDGTSGLYHAGLQAFNTGVTGVTVRGDDINILSIFKNGTTDVQIHGSQNGYPVHIKGKTSSGSNVTLIHADPELGVSLQNGVAINEFSNDGTMSDMSPSAVPTELAVWTFVAAVSATQDDHNELNNIQGGIPSASEFYHLSESIHDGLFSGSPTIGLGIPSATRFEVDYGNDTITANTSGSNNGALSMDGNEFTVSYGGFPHLSVTEDDTYLGRQNTDYIWVDDSGNTVKIYAINTLAGYFANNNQIIGRNAEAGISTWQGGLNEIRGYVGNNLNFLVGDTTFSLGTSATGIIQVRDNAIQMHDGNLLIMDASSARQKFGRSDDSGTYMELLTLAGDQSFISLRLDGFTQFTASYSGTSIGNTGSDGTRISMLTPSGPGQADSGNKITVRVQGDRAVFTTSGMELTGRLDTTGDLYVSGGDVYTSKIHELGSTDDAIVLFGGTVSLYKDGNLRFGTAADGVNLYGGWTHIWDAALANQASTVMSGNTFRMFTNVNSGVLRLGANNGSGTYQDGIHMTGGGATNLYYDGNKVAETAENGFTVTTSAGIDIARFSETGLEVDGSGDFSGHVAIGADASVTNSIVNIIEDGNEMYAFGWNMSYENLFSDAGAWTLGMNLNVSNTTSTAHDRIVGISLTTQSSNNTGGATVTDIIGIKADAVLNGDDSIATRVIGGDFAANTGGSMSNSTITNAIAGRFNLLRAGSGDVDIINGYGVLVKTPSFTPAGSATDLYGLYIEDQSTVGFTTDYNLYSAGADSTNKFEGIVEVDAGLEYLNISTVTAQTTASNSDVILTNAPSGSPFTVYLQESDRASITVKKIDNEEDTTVEGLSGNIDGQANTTLTSQYESKTFVWDGSNWFII